jgi:hypothetical protein
MTISRHAFHGNKQASFLHFAGINLNTADINIRIACQRSGLNLI